MCVTWNTCVWHSFFQLDNFLWFRLIKIKKIDDFLIVEINYKEEMVITMLDYAEKTFLVLWGASSGVSLCSFTTVMVRLWEKASYSISLVFRISNVIVKMFSRAIGKKKISIERLLYWPEGNWRA